MSRNSLVFIVLGLLLLIILLALCYRDVLLQEKFEGEGRLEVRGWARGLFYVYSEADGQRKDFTRTGKSLTLPAGR